MKYSYQLKVSFLIIGCYIMQPVYADNLGRLFTSAKERQKLEKIRHTTDAPRKIEVEEVVEIEKPVVTKKEIVIRDPITLKGLVHRGGGKSTAWFNDGNTFDGSLDSDLVQVPGNKIKSDQVTIIMPDDSAQVDLKVGDVFTPAPLEKDIADTVINQDSP